MKASKCGFSLVELIVSVAILGILVCIALPTLLNIFGEAESAKTTRNAHTIATTYASARAAGATFTSSPTDVRGMVMELNEGKNGAGMMADSLFSVNPLSSDEMNAVLKRLRYLPETDSLVISSGN
jgi:prepilin-type N-terminal cleavage/methylation domain-containing protein